MAESFNHIDFLKNQCGFVLFLVNFLYLNFFILIGRNKFWEWDLIQ